MRSGVEGVRALKISACFGILLMFAMASGAGFLLVRPRMKLTKGGVIILGKAVTSTCVAGRRDTAKEPDAQTPGSSAPLDLQTTDPAPTDTSPAAAGAHVAEDGGRERPETGERQPEPAWEVPVGPPDKDRRGVTGRWTVQLRGGIMPVQEFHVTLGSDGSVRLNPSTGGVLPAGEGSYRWDREGGRIEISFSGETCPGGGAKATLRLTLEGVVDRSLGRARGTVTADIQGFAASPGAVAGTFDMRR